MEYCYQMDQNYGYNMPCQQNNGLGFTLVIVLFILLVIIGISYCG